MIRFRPIVIAVALATISATAAAGNEPGNPAAGLTAYESACSECHANAARLARRHSDDPAAETARLDVFLAEHHAPDETARRDIIAYLLSL